MLWPGQGNWFEKGGSLSGFFGPYTFAQVFSRTSFMVMAAALAGGFIAATFEDREFRSEMIRRMSLIGIAAAIAGSIFFQWGLTQLPESATLLLRTRLPGYFVPALWGTLMVIMSYFLFMWLRPDLLRAPMALVMMLVLMVFGIWPEERARESMRKPFVAGQFMYSNQIIGKDVPALGVRSEIPHLFMHSVLRSHPFIPSNLRQVTPANEIEVGHTLALIYCANCHALGTQGMRPFGDMFQGNRDASVIQAFIDGALVTGHMINMPQVPLSAEESHALALFIAGLPLWQATRP
jgi:hypothetical protein